MTFHHLDGWIKMLSILILTSAWMSSMCCGFNRSVKYFSKKLTVIAFGA
jgi:hypothetical protein